MFLINIREKSYIKRAGESKKNTGENQNTPVWHGTKTSLTIF